MVTIRAVEDAIQSLFLRGEVYGTTHLCSGQEAVAVGVASVLGLGRSCRRDLSRPRSRSRARHLGRALLAEMLGRATGDQRRAPGSMNINSLAHRLIGSFGIVGGSIAAATGAGLALAAAARRRRRLFGKGATNQAYFFECFNFAALYGLPVVFVCENNVYSEYTRTTDLSSGGIQARAAPLACRGRQVDGMSVWTPCGTPAKGVADAALGGGDPVPRGAHLPLRRPLAKRPGEVSARRRARRLETARSAEALPGAARPRRASTRPASPDTIEGRAHAEVAEAVEAGLAAAGPIPASLPGEFKE